MATLYVASKDDWTTRQVGSWALLPLQIRCTPRETAVCSAWSEAVVHQPAVRCQSEQLTWVCPLVVTAW